MPSGQVPYLRLALPAFAVVLWLGAFGAEGAERRGTASPPKSALPPAGKGQTILRGAPGTPSAEAPKTAPAAAPKAQNPSPGASGEAPARPGRGVVQFVRAYGVWIVAGLGAVIAAVVIWAVVDARRKGVPVLADAGGLGFESAARKAASSSGVKRYSSTRIRKSEVAGRAGKEVTETEVETEREYALVVDEEALKLPPRPDAADSAVSADPAKVRELVDAKKYREAYAEYEKQTSGRRLAFPGDLEAALGEGLIRIKEYAKAAAVLERHVGSHPQGEVKPETYFNLAYAHFMNRGLEKAKRFFEKYVSVEKNPALAERAKRVLERLDPSAKR